MKKYTLTLFFTVLPAAAGAITAEIPAGTVVNGGDVHSIVTQKVFGEANNFTVSGVQQQTGSFKRRRFLQYRRPILRRNGNQRPGLFFKRRFVRNNRCQRRRLRLEHNRQRRQLLCFSRGKRRRHGSQFRTPVHFRNGQKFNRQRRHSGNPQRRRRFRHRNKRRHAADKRRRTSRKHHCFRFRPVGRLRFDKRRLRRR